MSRKKYDTPEDRERAKRVAAIFAQKMCYRAIEIGDAFSSIDFHLQHATTSRIEAFAEVKVRGGKADDYEKMIALLKYVEIKKYVHATGLPCFIIWAYPEDKHRIKYVEVNSQSKHPRVGWGGREDRGDKADKEAMVFFDRDIEQELIYKSQ